MAIRCYIPTTLSALGAGLAAVPAVTPDAQGRALSGEDLESLEFDALCIAAALAAGESFAQANSETAASPRVVVAYDAPDSSPREELAPGFELLSLDSVDMSAVASLHLDEHEIWDEAVAISEDTGPEAAEDHLGESDLLWYDVTELPELLRELS